MTSRFSFAVVTAAIVPLIAVGGATLLWPEAGRAQSSPGAPTVIALADQQIGRPDAPAIVGRPVRFTNIDAVTHVLHFATPPAALTAPTPAPLPPPVRVPPGSSADVRFGSAGTFVVQCEIHAGMRTTLTVSPAPPPSGETSANPPGQTTITTDASTRAPTTIVPTTIAPTTIDSSTVAPSTVDASTTWTVRFGGDSLMTRTIRVGDQPFGRVHPALGDADLAIVNVETAIATTGTAAEKDYTFRSPPAFARQIAAAGIDAVSLANNHSLDYGRTALEQTIAHLQSAGVTPFGAGADLTSALAPAEYEVRGQRVAVLGASQIIPSPTWLATSTRSGIVSAGKHVIDARTERLLDAVRDARGTHDVVLVVLHWGIEGDACPSAVQRRLGRLLREAGATAVLGAHPHVLQPVIADETGLVAYSMGNFIWDPRGGETADTGVLELVFDGARLVEHRVYPHRLDGNGWAAAVDPEGATGRRILARVERRCPA